MSRKVWLMRCPRDRLLTVNSIHFVFLVKLHELWWMVESSYDLTLSFAFLLSLPPPIRSPSVSALSLFSPPPLSLSSLFWLVTFISKWVMCHRFGLLLFSSEIYNADCLYSRKLFIETATPPHTHTHTRTHTKTHSVYKVCAMNISLLVQDRRMSR